MKVIIALGILIFFASNSTIAIPIIKKKVQKTPFTIRKNRLKKNKEKKTKYQISLQHCHFTIKDSSLKLLLNDSLFLLQEEDSLIQYINKFQTDTLSFNVKYYDSLFIRKFASCLKKRMSFAFPFTRLQDYIYIVYPDDSSFRIITWQYSLNAMTVFQQGVLQMQTHDTTTLFYPLLDRSNNIKNPLDTIVTNTNWIGALYYDVISNVDKKGNNIYTLIGLDENTLISNKKWLDILTFDESCRPVFGGDYFNLSKRKKTEMDNTIIDTATASHQNTKRFFIEYNKNFIANLKFDDNLGMIVFDALVPHDEGLKTKKYSYVIDGQYEGFKWENYKWKFVPQVFEDYVLPNNEAPSEKPLQFDSRGFPIVEPNLKKK